MNSKELKTRPVPAPRLRFPGFKGEWEEKTGGQLFNQISNKKHNSDLPILAITQDKGAVPRSEIDYHVSVTNESVDSYKVVEVDDFIISLRSFQGGIEYSRYKGICSPAYIILRATKEVATGYFQHYFKYAGFVKDLTKNLEGLRDGKMISYKQFSEVPIPLPPTLPEQTRIAAALSSLDAVIAAHQNRQDALRQHKRGLMVGLFPAEGERVPRLRFPEFEGAGEWEVKTVGQVSTSFSGGTPSTSNREYYGGRIPFIRSAEIASESTELFLTESGLANSAAKMVDKGDLLVALYGANSGETGISRIRGAINQAILCIRPKTDTRFMYQFLAHSKDRIIALYIQGGQGNLSGEIIKSVKIPIPPLPSEQTRIAAALSSLDDLITAQGENIVALQEFKRGLMQGLFPATGREE
ncbi:restriction endonuclease subunit S [Deinococcus aquaedulcis]|uniref:restriction endonuclease subunit S n=1 Tax=Deinococcus aquaedulcis TaxID=2840455 RepID=UPI001C82D67A|nr:restriction endonuclease subunit S [Deinococcus aquaedulcis]